MREITQPYKRPQAPPVSWFQFATSHRAGIASLVVLVFPLVMPFTALAVNIEVLPTHIAGLPVAVNLNCHSTRRATIVV